MEESINKLVLKEFSPKYYDEYASWWADESYKPPPLSSLPKVGLVCGDMNAVSFLGMVDCDFSIVMWWRCNPKNTPRESYNSLKIIMSGFIEITKIMGKNKIFVTTQNRGMIRLLESLNFVNYDGHVIAEVL